MRPSTLLRYRILTAAIGVPLALGVLFYAPGDFAYAFFLVAFFWAAVEFIAMAKHFAPSAPIRGLWWMIPTASIALYAGLNSPRWLDDSGALGEPVAFWLVLIGGLLAVVPACTVLFSDVDVKEGLVAVGVLTFAIPYFALPPVALAFLHAIDPWIILWLISIVWLGDTAAFFTGRRFGRHKLAPITSPNKSWEGACASVAIALVATAVWAHLRLGAVLPALLLVALCTSVAAQAGDLVESMVKRGAGVKDSSNILPGHGGFFDRLDALLLAIPVFLIGCWLVGFERLVP